MTKVHKKQFKSKFSANESVSEVPPEEGLKVKDSRQCPRFNFCSSPLCPMDESSLIHGLWYSDEEYCPLKEFSSLSWVRNQRKIAARCKNPDTYFKISMLEHDCMIKNGISGIDPDSTGVNDSSALKMWFEEHPKKREINEEEREKARQRMIRVKANSMPAQNSAERLDLAPKSASRDCANEGNNEK